MPLTTYTAGQVLTAASLNANFSFAAGGAPTAIFNETQASGTNGGTLTSGSWFKRTLNTTVENGITGCSIASSVITLPAGTYSALAFMPNYRVDNCQSRIQNTTDSTTVQFGQSAAASNASSGSAVTMVVAYFTIASSKNFELQNRGATTHASLGCGVAASFGNSEIYAMIQITKVA